VGFFPHVLSFAAFFGFLLDKDFPIFHPKFPAKELRNICIYIVIFFKYSYHLEKSSRSVGEANKS
jgi:hypothetical protein